MVTMGWGEGAEERGGGSVKDLKRMKNDLKGKGTRKGEREGSI